MLNTLNVLLFVVGVPIKEKFILGNKSKECNNFFLSIYFALDINSEILPNIVFPEIFQQQVSISLCEEKYQFSPCFMLSTGLFFSLFHSSALPPENESET